MDLPEFIEEVSGKPLTDLQQSLLQDLRRSYSGKSRIGVILGTHRVPSLPEIYLDPLRIGKAIHAAAELRILKGRRPDLMIIDEYSTLKDVDFAKLEERLIGHGSVLWDTNGRIYEPEEYLIAPGHRGSGKLRDYTKAQGFPEFTQPHQVGADHPSKKREPKGPRKRWGKL